MEWYSKMFTCAYNTSWLSLWCALLRCQAVSSILWIWLNITRFLFPLSKFVQSWSDQHNTIQLNHAFSDIRLYHFAHIQSSVLLLSTFLSVLPYIFIVPMQNVGSLLSRPCHSWSGANDFCSLWQSWSYHCSKHTGKYVKIVGLVY